MKILSVEQMQRIESTANESGITYAEMMQTAGEGIADWIRTHLPAVVNTVGLVGSGNNGGDTLIALTQLSRSGRRATAFLFKPRDDDLVLYLRQAGGAVIDLTREPDWEAFSAVLHPNTVVLDGILGTGISLPLREDLKPLMVAAKKHIENARSVAMISVDCPSGIDCDTGEAAAEVMPASATLSMAAVKQGLLKEPAASLTGSLHGIDIGIGRIEQYLPERMPQVIDPIMANESLGTRSSFGHKGTFGTCLVLAGSEAYTGAALLSGKAAYRAGAGLVNVASLKTVHDRLAGSLAEAVWTVLPEVDSAYHPSGVDLLAEKLLQTNALILGPGLGMSDHNLSFLAGLLPRIPKDLPVVIDADGLRLLSMVDRWWEKLPLVTILTPHPGEMASLTGIAIADIQADRWEVARKASLRWGVTLVLKGAMTVIATPAGDVFINPVSDSALATAGSGDVLSGLLGGLLAQGIAPVQAAVSGVWLHGQAGVIAGRVLGSAYSVTAGDIEAQLPAAFKNLKEAGPKEAGPIEVGLKRLA